MSAPESSPRPQLGAPAFTALPRDEKGPVFEEPWQAQAFALAVELSAQGHFFWSEWAQALSRELKAAAARGEPDDGTHYYEHWLAALEKLLAAKHLFDAATLAERKAQWRAAYLATPHGKPVDLAAARHSHERGRDRPSHA